MFLPVTERILMASETDTTMTPTRGYSATKEQLLKRLRRVEGQVRGIEGMVEDERGRLVRRGSARQPR
jgi:hypothetical protein